MIRVFDIFYIHQPCIMFIGAIKLHGVSDDTLWYFFFMRIIAAIANNKSVLLFDYRGER